MKLKQNCWEFNKCGRQPSGHNTQELGVCPVYNTANANGINNGKNAGRACWAIPGSMCDGEVRGNIAEKLAKCLKCKFYAKVRDEEGDNFKSLKEITELLKANLKPGVAPVPLETCTQRIEGNKNGKKIMVVDDSTSVRESISFVLIENGYNVLAAENGQEAFTKLKGQQVDLVITDLNMPLMNGIELTAALRASANHKYTPIIFLTTESQVRKKELAKEAGATGWIVKPFIPDKLLHVTQKILGK